MTFKEQFIATMHEKTKHVIDGVNDVPKPCGPGCLHVFNHYRAAANAASDIVIAAKLLLNDKEAKSFVDWEAEFDAFCMERAYASLKKNRFQISQSSVEAACRSPRAGVA